MRIEINNYRKIFGIQEEFNSFFPNLKIEFYEKPDNANRAPSKKLVKSSKTIAECRSVHNSGFITLLKGMTAGELKQNFADVYSLSIDLFQKTGNNTWSATPVSDNAVLEELNNTVEYFQSS